MRAPQESDWWDRFFCIAIIFKGLDGVVALAVFDILMVVPTWHEYRRHRARRIGAS